MQDNYAWLIRTEEDEKEEKEEHTKNKPSRLERIKSMFKSARSQTNTQTPKTTKLNFDNTRDYMYAWESNFTKELTKSSVQNQVTGTNDIFTDSLTPFIPENIHASFAEIIKTADKAMDSVVFLYKAHILFDTTWDTHTQPYELRDAIMGTTKIKYAWWVIPAASATLTEPSDRFTNIAELLFNYYDMGNMQIPNALDRVVKLSLVNNSTFFIDILPLLMFTGYPGLSDTDNIDYIAMGYLKKIQQESHYPKINSSFLFKIPPTDPQSVKYERLLLSLLTGKLYEYKQNTRTATKANMFPRYLKAVMNKITSCFEELHVFFTITRYIDAEASDTSKLFFLYSMKIKYFRKIQRALLDFARLVKPMKKFTYVFKYGKKWGDYVKKQKVEFPNMDINTTIHLITYNYISHVHNTCLVYGCLLGTSHEESFVFSDRKDTKFHLDIDRLTDSLIDEIRQMGLLQVCIFIGRYTQFLHCFMKRMDYLVHPANNKPTISFNDNIKQITENFKNKTKDDPLYLHYNGTKDIAGTVSPRPESMFGQLIKFN